MSDQTCRRVGLCVAAALWATVFGVVHVAWSMGSYVALSDPAAADAAFSQTWFQVYNFAIAVGCAAVAVGALALTRMLDARLRRGVRALLAVASAVLLLRSALGIIQLIGQLLDPSRNEPLLAWAADGYMLLGGVLIVSLVGATRSTDSFE